MTGIVFIGRYIINYMRKERILLCKPKMSGRELDFIKDALAEDWAVPMGPDVNAFEHELEEFVNNRYEVRVTRDEASTSSLVTATFDDLHKRVVAVESGTSAIHLALMDLGVGGGDEVIVQSFTFCASTNPIVYCGATPVFVDSERESWNIDPELLEHAITDRIRLTGKKPKAIIPVALYGMPYRIDRILEIASRYEIPVIEDAAEGFGSRYNGQVLGTFGDYGILSFNGNKMITTSGGGAVICRDAATRSRLLWMATQARESYPYYQHERVGYNYRLSNISACIGRAQMTVLEEHIAHHRHIQSLYREYLRDLDGIILHENPAPEFDSNFWLCTVTVSDRIKVVGEENAYSQVVSGAVGGAAGVTHTASDSHTDCEPNPNIEALRLALDKANVEVRPVWKPMHRQPVFKHCPAYVNGVSEEIFRTGLCLPAGPYVTDEDVRYITDVIKDNILRN